MSNRHRYAFNGVHTFENAREHMEANDFPWIPVGTIGGIERWFLKMIQVIENDTIYYCPFIQKPGGIEPKIKIHCYFVYYKRNGLSEPAGEDHLYLVSDRGYRGHGRSVWALLNEENGYMTNGGITIEYGFQIEGILSSDNIWTFNFHDPVFDCQENQNMITFYTGEERTTFFFCHKQLLSHHSSYLNLELKENDMMEISDYFIDCFDYLLQIGHGVRGIGGVHKTYETLEFALEYKLPNVIQLIDQTARINSWRLENLVSEAIYYGLKHCLAEFLREQRTAEELVEVLKKMDLETMSGEIMKKCVKRFLELEIMEEEPSVFV